MDGYHLQGWLSEVNGKAVADAINAAIGVPPEGDVRSLQERNAQGLTDISHTILSTGTLLPDAAVRSEERRVGKECRIRRATEDVNNTPAVLSKVRTCYSRY